ncbi:hypothetical protein C8R32_1382 [Nitrosospira sp. Nsp5]|uniref:Yip1 domain-containing protein n=1 Tax=Nitrosospira multiformis TaxID=1231 RepID=A0ABY0TIS6_9PROT|nr:MULTISPECIES: hypothetical protein [Nitrosospira]PTR05022.1 hypothetical protein C8R32_1382 [Nitrosospira sp. Nsp5]SDQ89114.1 hypothetical protein SAMN05216402_2708 [Nitrosospira multiformis]
MNEYLKLVMTQFPKYFVDLRELAVGPKKFLTDRCVPSEESLNRAFIFFGISLLIVAIIQIASLAKRSHLFLNSVIFIASVGIIPLTTILALWLAWKIVGGKAKFRELFTCSTYVSAFVVLIALTFDVAGEVIFQVVNPDDYKLILEGEDVDRWFLAGQNVSNGLSIYGVSLGFIWFIDAWGAYRALNGVSSMRSVIAFLLYSLLNLLLVVLAIFYFFLSFGI